MTLLEACREIMQDHEFMAKHPNGLSAPDIRDEIEERHPGKFWLCTWLDVHDEMVKFYGQSEREA